MEPHRHLLVMFGGGVFYGLMMISEVKATSKSHHLFYHEGGSEFSLNCLLICDVSFAQPQSG